MNKSTKKAAIYDYILEKLITRQYRFGEKIVVKELSEETGVSRQPIMSALSNLQERGFVEITAQVGCTVYRPSSSEVRDFYRLFSTNEGLVAALAAERGRRRKCGGWLKSTKNSPDQPGPYRCRRGLPSAQRGFPSLFARHGPLAAGVSPTNGEF